MRARLAQLQIHHRQLVTAYEVAALKLREARQVQAKKLAKEITYKYPTIRYA